MVGTIYVSHSTKAGEEPFKSIPFSNANIDWRRDDASTMSFNSPISLEEADKVRYYKGPNSKRDFGGQIYKRKKSATSGEFQYECISYTRLYHDKVTCSYKNMTSSQIMKKVLKLSKNDFRTSGIKNTEIVHSYLLWEDTSIYDIALQLAWLEQQVGYHIIIWVDAEGTLNFRYAPEQQQGYSFTSVLDYEEEYDSSDIITASKITFDGKTLATSTASKDLIAKWGYVTEVDECQAETTNTKSDAQGKAKELKDQSQISKYNISSKVVDQALKIAKSKNTPSQNLKLLFEWCKNHCKWEGYASTKYGATKMLTRRKGNCCDNAHLLIALARSIGIKARYVHAKKKSGKPYGHVWGEYYINNKWFTVDTGCTNPKWGSHSNYAGRGDVRYDKLPF